MMFASAMSGDLANQSWLPTMTLLITGIPVISRYHRYTGLPVISRVIVESFETSFSKSQISRH